MGSVIINKWMNEWTNRSSLFSYCIHFCPKHIFVVIFVIVFAITKNWSKYVYITFGDITAKFHSFAVFELLSYKQYFMQHIAMFIIDYCTKFPMPSPNYLLIITN